MKKHFVGAVEAGGTKMVCAYGNDPEHLTEIRFPTTSPAEVIPQVIDFFRRAPQRVEAIGFGSFGPIEPDPVSPDYGFITSTPKPGWAQTNVVGPLKTAFGVPVAFDTDVNAAALGEQVWGAAQGLNDFVYLTIGTGIGAGIVSGGNLVHGLMHPEGGHILIPIQADDPFRGNCCFHGACFEGLASGSALVKRWGKRGDELPPDHPAWEMEAQYIASALVNYICILSPKRIILGGGLMERSPIFPLIRQKTLALLNGYIHPLAMRPNLDDYIVPPQLGNKAGILGAMALAQRELN